MIPHIKMSKLLLILVIYISISCKENTSNNNKDFKSTSIDSVNAKKAEINSVNEAIGSNYTKNTKDKWIFENVESIWESTKCKNIDQYTSVDFYFSNDSVFINNVYTDDIFNGEIESDILYKKHGLTKEFILKKFNLDTPEKIEYIRNKKAFDKSSKLDLYFQDAFFIDKYLLFEKDGCVYKFKNKLFEKKYNHPTLNFPISSKEIEKIEPSKLQNKIFSDYNCGTESRGYYLKRINEYDIFILINDCGDFPYKDLISVKGNQIISKILIESDSWDIEKDEKNIRDETILKFKISNPFDITITQTHLINSKIDRVKEYKYVLDINGEFVEK
ncbi:hypothetical protein [Kaistella jeonii]|uniref:Lipoprotein n=2 Tax=Kaistella jeonii TaxID=266749 RepID=A0A0C1FBS4_9FLAO|nr:hypothetical protein [Kaistella jeonii]KIA85474.1 hypothetical protein OA86_14600 [Kaistella jeonii]SFC41787.1 hypothetical protein SAMN05421876_12013 [Kaistella jeonii]VEI97333.1 Uncharacterised protein [Kaistella jeonii]